MYKRRIFSTKSHDTTNKLTFEVSQNSLSHDSILFSCQNSGIYTEICSLYKFICLYDIVEGLYDIVASLYDIVAGIFVAFLEHD